MTIRNLFLIWLTVVLTIGIGWAINIYKLVHMSSEITGLLIARVAGIFVPPLGTILGYFV